MMSLPAPLPKLAAFFERTPVDRMLDGSAPAGGDPDLERALAAVRRRAPLALRAAERLIEEGMRLSMGEGLALEQSRLEGILSTEDALAGLRSVGGDPPAWKGR